MVESMRLTWLLRSLEVLSRFCRSCRQDLFLREADRGSSCLRGQPDGRACFALGDIDQIGSADWWGLCHLFLLRTRGDVRNRASCSVYLTDSDDFEFRLLCLLLRLHLRCYWLCLQALSVVEQVWGLMGVVQGLRWS